MPVGVLPKNALWHSMHFILHVSFASTRSERDTTACCQHAWLTRSVTTRREKLNRFWTSFKSGMRSRSGCSIGACFDLKQRLRGDKLCQHEVGLAGERKLVTLLRALQIMGLSLRWPECLHGFYSDAKDTAYEYLWMNLSLMMTKSHHVYSVYSVFSGLGFVCVTEGAHIQPPPPPRDIVGSWHLPT